MAEYKVIRHADGSARKNAKYIARIELGSKGGKKQYRYFYTNAEYQAYLKGDRSIDKEAAKTTTSKTENKNSVGKFLSSIGDGLKSMSDNTKKSVNQFFANIGLAVEEKVTKIVQEKLPEVANKVVDVTKDLGTKFIDDKENIYDVKSWNYDEKIAKIAETPEWKAIIAREDPEYVRKNEDGSKSYLIDDYLVKKKMPVLDVIDDIVSNRPVTINEINRDAIVAGLKSNAVGTLSVGIMAAGVLSKAMMAKMKFSQGSYNDEIKELTKSITAGADYVDKTIETVRSAKSAADTVIKDDDVQMVVDLLKNTNVAEDTKEAKKAINEKKIVEAAKIIMNSNAIPEGVKENDYFELVENTLSNLTEEEVRMVNLMISAMTKGG